MDRREKRFVGTENMISLLFDSIHFSLQLQFGCLPLFCFFFFFPFTFDPLFWFPSLVLFLLYSSLLITQSSQLQAESDYWQVIMWFVKGNGREIVATRNGGRERKGIHANSLNEYLYRDDDDRGLMSRVCSFSPNFFPLPLFPFPLFKQCVQREKKVRTNRKIKVERTAQYQGSANRNNQIEEGKERMRKEWRSLYSKVPSFLSHCSPSFDSFSTSIPPSSLKSFSKTNICRN